MAKTTSVTLIIRFKLITEKYLNNNTFQSLFGRIEDVKNKTVKENVDYTIRTNRFHYSEIQRMSSLFSVDCKLV